MSYGVVLKEKKNIRKSHKRGHKEDIQALWPSEGDMYQTGKDESSKSRHYWNDLQFFSRHSLSHQKVMLFHLFFTKEQRGKSPVDTKPRNGYSDYSSILYVLVSGLGPVFLTATW